MARTQKVAIIGAGMAGIRLAQCLGSSADIDVYEKSRGVGGRMSTRRALPHQFDHGAQYFTAHGYAFQEFLKPFLISGDVKEWTPNVVELRRGRHEHVQWTTPRYVAVPGMTALVKAMANSIDATVHLGQRVANLDRQGDTWTLVFEDGSARTGYNWVFSTAPAEQAALLLPSLTDWSAIRMQGCYSLMLGFQHELPLSFDAAIVKDSPIAWIAVDSSKPSRTGAYSVLCQSDNMWAETHMESDPSEVLNALCASVREATGIDPDIAVYRKVHRWRFAKVARPAAQPFLLNTAEGLGAAGDWCGSGRVEAAFDSANALASDVLMVLDQKAA